MENNVDRPQQVGYNDPNNDDNAFVVKMDEQRPAHDNECKHETLIPNPKDTIGDSVYHGCANDKCGVGFYIQKS